MEPLNLGNLKIAKGAKRKKRRLGRGNASGKGNYSGKGMKGQRARSGGRNKLSLKGIRGYLLRIPKNRGFKSYNIPPAIVNLSSLEKIVKNNQEIDPKFMLSRGLIRTTKYGVKILGEGQLNKKLIVRANYFSKNAKQAILKAGGRIEVITKASHKV